MPLNHLHDFCHTICSRIAQKSVAVSSAVISAEEESISGYYLSKSPLKNKGISFSHSEREKLGLRGLFPAGDPISLERKIETAMENFRDKV